MGAQFTNPEFFGRLGQPLLVCLLKRFAQEFTAQETDIPDPTLEEKEYFKELALLGASKKGFPPKLHDVLYGIAAMGTEQGKDRLIYAASQLGILASFNQTSTCQEFALEFYLASPEIFERKVHENQILARSSFHVFGSCNPVPEGNEFRTPRARHTNRALRNGR